MFLTAAMEHFRLQDVADIPDSFVPEDVASGTPDIRRAWLHEKTSEVVDKYIMLGHVPGVSEDPMKTIHKKQFPCRAQGCQQVYTYLKARDNHELKKHNLDIPTQTVPEQTTPSNSDHKQEHTLARLSFSFFIMDMMDAVKEGDGGRLMRLYKVALLYYKAHGHSHYAYSTFLLTLQVNASLTPRDRKSVV